MASDSRSLGLFAAGIVIGGAAAGGVAYAITKHLLEQAERSPAAQDEPPQSRAAPQEAWAGSPHPYQQQQQHRHQQRQYAGSTRSAASRGAASPLRGAQWTNNNEARSAQPPQRQATQPPPAGSPRVEWLTKEDTQLDDDGVLPGAAGPSFADSWCIYDAGAGVGGTMAAGTTMGPHGTPANGSYVRLGDVAGGSGPPSTRNGASADALSMLPSADRNNPAAIDVLKNPGLHMPTHTHLPASPRHQHKLANRQSATDKMADTGKAIEQAASMYDDYCRVITPENLLTDESEEVCAMLIECLELRRKWLCTPALGPEQRKHEDEAASPSDVDPTPMAYRPLPQGRNQFRMRGGVLRVYAEDNPDKELYPVPGTAADFFADMHRVLRYASLGPVKSFCHHRLMLLEQKFNLHVMLNADKEFLAQKSAPHRDFYNVRKVDTHIHHSACMHQKHLLRFIKSKLRKEPDEVVIFRDGKYLTLREVFESLNLTGYDLNVDTLDMHADKNTFHRFDRFNLKYNPCGQSRLREIFVKQDNLIHGRFLAELTQEVFSDLEASKYQHAEMRISVYGRKQVEWDILASWVVGNNLWSNNVVWLIQIPRLYNVYRDQGIIENFEQMLENIFVPLFEATLDPASHPQLHVFLSQVVGFDMVDDESKPERRPTKHSPQPQEWTSKHNAAYSYYAYYIYANLFVLNKFREERGLNTFSFRPHSGEAGDTDHLVATMMLAENIAHGINLRKSPCLQYLYYLAQIGLCMSPLSNNSLFLDYHRNPFPAFFARGLSVSLSTDDPLQIHLTKEPLVEEYSIAAQVWKLSASDLCEIARNGVLHSGFPHACKKHWIAEEYWRAGPEGNDIHKTNVPNLRLRFRYDTYVDEMRLVVGGMMQHQARKASIISRNESQS